MPIKERVRTVTSTPTVADFAATEGTPLVIDVVGVAAYILDSTNTVRELGTGGGGGGGGGGTRWGSGVDTTDDLIVDNSDAGLVLKSPDGNYWRFQVNNSGALVTTNLGTTKP